MGSGKDKELICATHGHELSGGGLLKGMGLQGRGGAREKNGTTVIA